MWVVVYRPVKELIDGTHRVAGGDLDYRLPVRSDDELGDLAASFNKMTAEVGGVQAKIEEQVRRKTAELERVHKTLLSSEKMASIGKLAATVAHEINNPLFGILTYARLISRELARHEFAGRDELAEQLQTIERESKRCGDLVKNLLTFSRQPPSRREPNDLNTIVRRAILLVKHKLDMQNIELRENLAEDLPTVECDANQIQQALLVLMVNASEAMPKGGTLEVATAFDRGNRAGVGAGQGHGRRHPGGRAAAHFRSVLHHEGGPEPHGPGIGRGAQHRGAARGRNLGPLHAGRRNGIHGGAAGYRGGHGGDQTMSGERRMAAERGMWRTQWQQQ